MVPRKYKGDQQQLQIIWYHRFKFQDCYWLKLIIFSRMERSNCFDMINSFCIIRSCGIKLFKPSPVQAVFDPHLDPRGEGVE